MPPMLSARAWLREKPRDPVVWARAIQLVKTVAAAVIAWVVAAGLLDLPYHFLAPWSALLVVHATVYRTFSDGAQQVSATVIGVLLAWLAGAFFGLDAFSLAVMVLVGLLLGQFRVLGDQGTTIAATGLIVLTTGYSDDVGVLFVRLGDSGIGIAVGLVVNLLVWPPFLDRSAARAVDLIDDKVGALLCEMADGLRGDPDGDGVDSWVSRSEEIDAEIDYAWALVRQSRESGRWNPRRKARDVRDPESFADVLNRLEGAVADTRSMARTVGHSVTNVLEWDPNFRTRWVDLLEETGRAIADADSRRIVAVHQGLADLAREMSNGDLPSRHWPEYGGLIANLRNIAILMDAVADNNPITPYRLTR